MILSDDSQIGVEIEDPFGDDDADIDLNVVLREIDEQVRPCTPTAYRVHASHTDYAIDAMVHSDSVAGTCHPELTHVQSVVDALCLG